MDEIKPNTYTDTTYGRQNYLVTLLVTLYTMEIMLGGGGRLITFGPLSLRMMIFFFFVLTFLMEALSFRTEIQSLTWKLLISIAVFVLFYSAVGVFNNAPLQSVFISANSYFTLLYIALLVYFFRNTRNGIHLFFKIFMFCSMVIALFTIVFFVMGIAGMIELKKLDDTLNGMAYGGNSGMMWGYIPRIHFVSQTVLQFAISVQLARILLDKEFFKHNRFLVSIQHYLLWLALIMTYTRGYWLGVIISMAILFHAADRRNRLRIILTMSLGLMVVVGSLVWTGAYEFKTLTKRFISSFETGDMELNKGNLVRVLEVREGIRQVQSHPLLGVGFGVPLPSSFYSARSAITGKDYSGTEYVIELTYIDLLRQIGITGFALVLFGLWAFCKKARGLLRQMRYHSHYPLLIGYLAGFAGFLFTATTNPYLLSSSGMFLVIIAVSLLLTWSEGSLKRISTCS